MEEIFLTQRELYLKKLDADFDVIRKMVDKK